MSVAFSWWGPPSQTSWTTGVPDHYNVYRDGVQIYGPPATPSGVTPDPQNGGGAHPQPWFCDRGLSPSSTHNYYVTAVVGGVESAPSPSITMTTLAGSSTATTPPAPPTDPGTWIAAYSLPKGGTVWTATNTAAGGWDSPGTGKNNATGCGLRYALQHANIQGGDVIVLTAGATYPTPLSGWVIPAFTGANGWTYIISSEDPDYKTGGKLIPYSYSRSNVSFKPYICTGPISAGATTATLSASTPWKQKTGAYWVLFSDGQERLVTLTQDSSAITWNNYNATIDANGNHQSAGLANSVTATVLVAYLNGVTPTDIEYMANLSSGHGPTFLVMIPAACNKVRFVGINMTPAPKTAGAPSIVGFSASHYGEFQQSAESIYFDRCIWGNDSASATYSFVSHGMSAVNCDHFLVHQCYCWGVAQPPGGGDSNNYVLGGGPSCWQNTYIEAVSEGIIYGGAYVDKDQIPHDIVYRYNLNHKPVAWQSGTAYNSFGKFVKNLLELKVGVRVECYGNLHLNCWTGAQAGYHGAAFGVGSRDQQALAERATNYQMCCPWVRITDVNIHDNQCYNVGTVLGAFTADTGPSGYTATLRFANNMCLTNCNYDSDSLRPIRLLGPVTDLTIDHNTIIINMARTWPQISPKWGIYSYKFGVRSGSYGNPMPYTPNPFSVGQDRATITNNIIDGNQAMSIEAGWVAMTNLTWSRNLTINDAATYPGPTHTHVPYTSIGFAQWQGNTAPPASPSDWNVKSGKYATASTTGGAIGATF